MSSISSVAIAVVAQMVRLAVNKRTAFSSLASTLSENYADKNRRVKYALTSAYSAQMFSTCFEA